MQAKLPRSPKFLCVPRNHYRNNKMNERVHLIWHIVFFITNTLNIKILFTIQRPIGPNATKVTPELHIRLFPLKSLFPPPLPPLRQQKNTLWGTHLPGSSFWVEREKPFELACPGTRQKYRQRRGISIPDLTSACGHLIFVI